MNKSNNHIFIRFIFLYLAFCFIVYFFDLGKTGIGEYFIYKINSVIPSIVPTAALTEDKESSSLILAISWALVLPLWILVNVATKWKGFDLSVHKRQPAWVYYLAALFLPLLIIAGAIHAPSVADQKGRYGYVISGLINVRFFMIFYSFSMLCFIVGILWGILGLPIYFLRKYFHMRRMQND